MLMAMIESIYETMNLRITETAFELHLRKIYPTRNILSMRETETVSGQECLDVQKKTDGSVNIIGEVATDPVASWMIQSAQVASKFTLFTHHAKTFPNLVTALRNSMLRTGVFKDEKTAEEQVVQVLNFDIHLVKDFRGRRYIERVTECIPIEERNEYTFDHRNEKTLEGKMDKFFDNATIFFSKTTNRELYKYQNVLELVDDGYVLSNPISEPNIKAMRENMNDNDLVSFDAFLERNWGIKPPKMIKYDENGNEILPTKEKTQEEKIKEMSKDFNAALSAEAKRAIGKKVERKETTIQKVDVEKSEEKVEEKTTTEVPEEKIKRTISKKAPKILDEDDEDPIIRSEILRKLNLDEDDDEE